MASVSAPAQLSPPPAPPPRDRAWLLPSNRSKLGSLQYLSIRNLSLSSDSASGVRNRGRRKTIDDDALPQSLTSPAKLVALNERHALEHSHSSADLRSATQQSNGVPKHPNGRPAIGRMRRRSTLEWVNAGSQRRQEKLEKVMDDQMMDVFCSIHARGIEEPVYITETVEKTMNPNFRHIDMERFGPGIKRVRNVTLTVWARNKKLAGWKQLLMLDLSLSNLQFLGKSLEYIDQPLPPNTILFHLSDGIYTPVTSNIPPPQSASSKPANSRKLPSSSFDALLRLAKLDDSIHDAIATRDKLASDLEELLQKNRKDLDEKGEVDEAEDRLKTIEYAKKTVKNQLEKARKHNIEKRDSLDTRRRLMSQDIESRKSAEAHFSNSQPELQNTTEERNIRRRAIASHRRRVTTDLSQIYPIRPVPNKSLNFTICDLALPSAADLDTTSTNPDSLAAALGYAAHLLLLLSFYLSRPLPYPLHPRASTSSVADPLSVLATQTKASSSTSAGDRANSIYPLHPKGSPRFRFEYALFLLNKDVQVLLEDVFGMRVMDVRQTLGNLKYMIYLATTGEGEIVGRKAGVVRVLGSGGVGERVGGGEQDAEKAHDDDEGAMGSLRRWVGAKGAGRGG